MSQYVFLFGDHPTGTKALLGGKGAGLAEMRKIGLPVPMGFTITTEVCGKLNLTTGEWPEGLEAQVDEGVRRLEELTHKRLGDPNAPLLVSVRSGAAISMPGMMDTVLNLGMTPQICDAVARLTNNARFARDSYRRFITMFGNVVMGVEHKEFEKVLTAHKTRFGRHFDNELTADELVEVIAAFKAVYQHHTGEEFPCDPRVQLRRAINAVFQSWNNPRAVSYRRINNITGLLGTAVNVQMMVFGNMGDRCATGVGFTRNPSTGERVPYGEFLQNAQGEDVVAGIRTPRPISELGTVLPEAHRQLMEVFQRLETHFRDVQDIEFTIENDTLYMLQTRNAKRTGLAAVRTAVEMVEEGLITTDEALMRVDAQSLTQLLLPRLEPRAAERTRHLASGLPASPGAAVGKIAFTAQEAVRRTLAKEKIILCREETCPDDIDGMNVCQGICTARGGMTSHAAVVARGMGKACVSGCGDMHIDEDERIIRVGDVVLHDTDTITIDGTSGKVYVGAIPIVDPEVSGQFATFMAWCDAAKRLGVRANAETEKDARKARELGCEGVGLARTEHMFFKPDRIMAMREMIVAETKEQRVVALNKLLPFQRGDFKIIFDIMRGLPVNIRLLDPPLHEFLPNEEADQRLLAEQMGLTYERIKVLVDSLHESNPMLGFRGCRLGIVYPEINEMQVRAIFEAAVELVREKPGPPVVVEVMIPVLAHEREMILLRELSVRVAEEVLRESGVADQIKYTVGVMMELPRACLCADDIAHHAEFFSFGTNDLTQTTLGYSRDDAGKFIPKYIQQGIYDVDPFQCLDQHGVGQLIQMSVSKGRSVRANLKCGICGEHGGEPSSIDFCHRVGLNYVSCSPFRVPVARLAAAQAAIRNRPKTN